MIYENTVIQYAPIEATDILKKDKAEHQKYLNLIETLRSLREFDPDAYEELEDAIKLIRGEKVLYSLNLLAEYGLLDNEAIQALLIRQERILAIVKSNKDIATIGEALQVLKG
jgi:hypothetical protein